MKKLFIAMMSLVLFNTQAYALAPAGADMALAIGFRNTNADVDVAGVSTTAKNSYQLGGIIFAPMSEPLWLRTGLFYSQRYVSTKAGTTETDYKMAYVDIPLTLMYKFSDAAGIWAGPVISLNQGKECSVNSGSCTVDEVQSMLMPIALGASFKFAPQMGAEVFYEMQSGKIFKNASNFKSIGANFTIYFE